MGHTSIILVTVDIGGNLLEVGLCVSEDDEVDDEEGGMEHEVGAADQHGAGPHAQLETAHLNSLTTSQLLSPALSSSLSSSYWSLSTLDTVNSQCQWMQTWLKFFEPLN